MMSKTAMKMPTLQKEQVAEFAIENPNISLEKSITFMKQLTTVAISSIAFLRGIFPPEAFTNKKLSGQPVHVLVGHQTIPGTKTLINWLKSAFELVHSQKLKKMILVIKRGLATLETYTFSFSYNDDAILYDVMREVDGKEEVVEQSKGLPEDIAKSVRQLVRSILCYATTLEPLPNNCEVSVKLNVDENTPPELLPECFQPSSESDEFDFPEEAETLKLGKVQTKFTTLKVNSKSVMNGSNQDEKIATQEDLEDEVPGSQQNFKAISLTSNSSLLDRSQFCENEVVENDSNTTNLSEKLSIVSLKDRTISCICECSDLLNDTIKCESCSTLQHKVCYKMLESNPVETHICVKCHNPKQGRFCWDQQLINDPFKKESALYRQALNYCCNSLQVSCKRLMTHLKIPRKMAEKIMLRLDKDGYLELATNKGQVRNVKPDAEQTIISRHFHADSSDNMDVEHSPGVAPIEANSKKRHRLNSEEKENCSPVKTSQQPKRRKILKTTHNLEKFSEM